MNPRQYEVGEYVTNPARPQWGPGRVLHVAGPKVTIYFRDVPGDDHRDALKTILVDRVVLDPAEIGRDAILDNLPPYKDGGFERLPGTRVTLEQGLEKFHALFPLYFEDPRYIGDLKERERAYKWAAHELFHETLGAGQLHDLLQDGRIDEAGRCALAVEGRFNLLAIFEKAALRDGLRDDQAAERFLTAFD